MALLNLFYQGNQGFSGGDGDGTLWYQGFDGSQWHGVQHLNIGGPANLTCAPSPVLWRNIPHIMHQGSGRNGQLWVTWYDGSIWRPDQQVPGVGMSWSPSAVVFNNNLYVFHPGYAENGELWYTVADGTSWSQDHQILANVAPPVGWEGRNGPMSLSPSAVVWNNVLYVFFQHGKPPDYCGSEAGNPGDGG